MVISLLCAFFLSLAVSSLAIPIIIRVADTKHLMDEPDSDRKLHLKKTPTLGGVAIFMGTIFSFASCADYLKLNYEIQFLIPALLLLFFAGILDDLLNLKALKKLSVQMICALLITAMGSLHLSSLWGMLGITEIPSFIGMIITFMVVISLINAFNLIDGVDGLASGLGFIVCSFFGIWFAMTGSVALSILSLSLAGALLGFLFYNFKNAKIFMGDTGSMMVGFIVSLLAVKFIENNRLPGVESSVYYVKAAPAIALAAVAIPLFDMIRVFFSRIINKRNPFSADRRHIHHMLLDLGLTHTQVSTILYLATILLILISLALRHVRSIQVITINLIIVYGASWIISLILKKQKHGK